MVADTFYPKKSLQLEGITEKDLSSMVSWDHTP